MLFLNRSQVEGLLDLGQLIDALAPAMAELSAGSVSLPPRTAARVPHVDGLLAAMPAYMPSPKALAAKLVGVFPENLPPLHTHQALVAVFDPDSGTPLAVMDGSFITEARTAAASALATRLLARPDAEVLLVVGTGAQARSHARTVPLVRRLSEVRIAGRDRRKADQVVAEVAPELQVSVRAVGLDEHAFEGADIVCATTHSPEPVVRGRWLQPGCHVTSIGFNPDGRELDDDAIRGAVVVVESRQAALAPYPSGSNDLIQPIRDGVITEEHIHAEVGELVLGLRPGRTSADQVTVYKSVGVAVQDVVAARLVLEAAREGSIGVEVDL